MKGGAPVVVDDQNEEEEEAPKPLDFSVPVVYDLVSADGTMNSSEIRQNIYLESMPLAIRFDIKYS